jgi:predicted HD superfamily hydrolase involved in NAD metabolism
MAMAYQTDFYKAYIAGLLHDNAKCIPNDKKLALCQKYGLFVSKAEKENPELLHAKLGACLAKEKYNIDDEEIIAAIASHTTGRPNMTMLEKIVYIADYIEPRRKPLKDINQIRYYAFCDIDVALQMILHNVLQYLETKDAVIDTLTLDTYQFYK